MLLRKHRVPVCNVDVKGYPAEVYERWRRSRISKLERLIAAEPKRTSANNDPLRPRVGRHGRKVGTSYRTPIEQIDATTGAIITTFPSVTAASIVMNEQRQNFYNAIKRGCVFAGFKWRKAQKEAAAA